MLNLEAAGYPIVLSVHDEVVAEVAEEFGSIEEFEPIMCRLLDWANGFPVKAEGGGRSAFKNS
jgi:DNA polymerase